MAATVQRERGASWLLFLGGVGRYPSAIYFLDLYHKPWTGCNDNYTWQLAAVLVAKF